MESPRTSYQKQFIYGQSNRLCQECVVDRPLLSQERWQILRAPMHDGTPSVLSAGLLFILSVGMICYRAGWWTAAWKVLRKAEALVPIPGADLRSGGH